MTSQKNGENGESDSAFKDNSDAVFTKAIAAGAKQIWPVETQYYVDGSAMFSDPFGHVWNVATHVEDVSPEEIQKRLAAMGH